MINVDEELLESGLPGGQSVLTFDKIKGAKNQRKYLTPSAGSPVKVVNDSPNQKSISSDTIINLNQ